MALSEDTKRKIRERILYYVEYARGSDTPLFELMDRARKDAVGKGIQDPNADIDEVENFVDTIITRMFKAASGTGPLKRAKEPQPEVGAEELNFSLPPGRRTKGVKDILKTAAGRGIGAGVAGAIGGKGSLRFRDPIFTGVKAKIWDGAVIWTIAIVIAILGTNAGFEKLAYAFVFYGIYKVLPDEYDVIASASQKFARRMEKEKVAQGFEDWASPVFQDTVRSSSGLLAAKSAVKFIGVLMLVAQLVSFSAVPLMSFFALMLLFTYYFSLPTSYSVDRPWHAIEAWTRMIVGVLVADFLWALLTGNVAIHFTEVSDILISLLTVTSQALADYFTFVFTPTGGSPASALFFLAIAFFAAMPTKEEYR